jgi:molybdopterin-guanine dinucleotide biosynthesis protein A
MFSGLILAGGQSSRIGKDKAFLKLNGKFLIQHVIENISFLTSDVLIIAPRQRKYLKLGLPVIPDLIPNLGPLGGIYTGLLNTKHKYNLVVSCDMPFINCALIKSMYKIRNGFDAVIIKTTKGLQPLGALYSKNCLEIIKEQIKNKKLKLKDFLKKLKIKIIDSEKNIPLGKVPVDKRELCFYNINQLKDLRLLQAKSKSSC